MVAEAFSSAPAVGVGQGFGVGLGGGLGDGVTFGVGVGFGIGFEVGLVVGFAVGLDPGLGLRRGLGDVPGLPETEGDGDGLDAGVALVRVPGATIRRAFCSGHEPFQQTDTACMPVVRLGGMTIAWRKSPWPPA